jgi:hypothetical protein
VLDGDCVDDGELASEEVDDVDGSRELIAENRVAVEFVELFLPVVNGSDVL